MTDTVSYANSSEPKGLGGWMIPPMLGTILAPFTSLKSVGGNLTLISGPQFSTFISSFQILLFVETFIVVAIICVWTYANYLLFKRKAQYPILFNALLLFTLCFGLAESAILYSAFGVPVDADAGRDSVKAFLFCLIWIPYMLRSRRVKNTFVN